MFKFRQVSIGDRLQIMNLLDYSTIQMLCQIVNDLLTVCPNVNHGIFRLVFSLVYFIGNINVKFLFARANKELHQIPQGRTILLQILNRSGRPEILAHHSF